MEYAELFGNEIIVKGPNENELTKTDNYTLKLLNGKTYPGGYYDSYTKRMYYPTIENYMFQGCSVSTGNTKFSSITEDDIVWRGQLSRDYLAESRYTVSRLGDVKVTFEME